MRKTIAAILTICSLISSVFAQTSSEILHELKQLGTGIRVLYIAAHPDDENTRLISWLTHEKNAEVAYLSLTRGSGGQNLIGSEIGDALGIIRTRELLEARRLDGARQFFTSARDFGYSKSANESLEKWNEQTILEDMVWVIRTYRPDIIITRFSAVENPDRPTHGHHTASAMLASKAFNLANDPKAFPNQLKSLQCWKTHSLAWNTSSWFYGSREKLEETLKKENRAYTRVDVSDYVAELGLSCTEVAALSRSMHKSQGFGSSPSFGEQFEYLEWMQGESLSDDLFEKIKSPFEFNASTKKLKVEIEKVTSTFNPSKPWESVPKLMLILEQFEVLSKTEPRFETKHLAQIISACLGLKIQVSCDSRYVARGDSARLRIEIRNPSALPIHNILMKFPDGKVIKAGNLAAKSFYQGNYSYLVTENAALTEPYWLQQAHDESLYHHLDGLSVGETVVPDGISDVTVSMTIAEKTLTTKEDIQHRFTDPVKGEIQKPMAIVPRASLQFDNSVYLTQNEAVEIKVSLTPFTNIANGFVEIMLPQGWKSSPSFYAVKDLKKGQTYVYSYLVKMEPGASSGKIKTMLKESLLISSSTAHEINYDHIPAHYWFEEAAASLLADKIVCKAKKVAYIDGAGDHVADALLQLGCTVDHLNGNSLIKTNFKDYDAVVMGIRSYNTIENIDAVLPLLFNYVNDGGVVIVQYNTTGNLKTKQSGPQPFTLGRGRVTKEEAPVTFLLPSHPVLNKPNKINESHFDNWVQERGLYFASEWHASYEAPLSMADPGEKAENGSLLILPQGKGQFVYTGLSFFRQLPAAKPGAYVLLANMLSLGKP